MPNSLLGTDHGDLYNYGVYYPSGSPVAVDFYRLHHVAAGSSFTVTFTIRNNSLFDLDIPATTDTANGYSVEAVSIAPGDEGDVVITYFPGDYGASSGAGFTLGFVDDLVWFPNGNRQTPPHSPAWATGFDDTYYPLTLLGGYGLLPVERLADLWDSSPNPLGPLPAGTPDFGDYTYTAAPFLVPDAAGGGAPNAFDSVSVTNGAGGWSVDVGEWRQGSGGFDLTGWAPIVTYTPPGNDPGPDSWTFVDVVFRDDWATVDNSGNWSSFSNHFPLDSFPLETFRLTGPIDETAYPLSVGRKTSRFIAYHGAVPTLPAGGGGLMRARTIGGGLSMGSHRRR